MTPVQLSERVAVARGNLFDQPIIGRIRLAHVSIQPGGGKSSRHVGLTSGLELLRIDSDVDAETVEDSLLDRIGAERTPQPEGPFQAVHIAVIGEIDAVLGRRTGGQSRSFRRCWPSSGCGAASTAWRRALPADHDRQMCGL